MLKGKCPKCGKEYYSAAIGQPENQMCEVCGSKILVYDESLEKTEAGRDQIEKKMRELLHSQDYKKGS